MSTIPNETIPARALVSESLARRDVAWKVWPADGERDAMAGAPRIGFAPHADMTVVSRSLDRPGISARMPTWPIAARQRGQDPGRCENVNHNIAWTHTRGGVSA